MKHNTTSEDYQETAALYALGALSQLEGRAFENHLRDGCDLCEQELSEFKLVVDSLGSSVPTAAPPSYLRELLAARIEKEEQAWRPPDTSALQSTTAPPRNTPSTRGAAASNYLPWAIAASIALFALVSFLAWRNTRNEVAGLQGELAAARDEARQLRARTDEASRQANELAQMNLALSSPGSRVITLSGQEPSPSSSAKIFWDVENKRWVVSADLPPPGPGKVYQLWFVTPEEKISAGLIGTDEKGHGFAVVEVPPAADKVIAAAITLEPEGGSAQPTLPIYALGKTG